MSLCALFKEKLKKIYINGREIIIRCIYKIHFGIEIWKNSINKDTQNKRECKTQKYEPFFAWFFFMK